MSEHPLDGYRQTLADWLAARLDHPGPTEVLGFDDPKSGYSAETTVLTVGVGPDATRRLVLRRETPEPPVYPVQVPDAEIEISLQYRVMHSLTGQVPLAPLIGFEQDPAIAGAPFFLMGFVDGDVPVEDPIYTSQGFFVDATPEQRRTMVNNGVEAMAALHQVDWRAAGLDWLCPRSASPTLARQLDLWEHYTRHELDARVHPLVDRAWTYLRTEQPDEVEPVLNWGDPRPGNIIWDNFPPACLTDFEAASLAPAEIDLGWWLMFDHWSHETMGVPRLPGEPTRAEQRDRYSAAIGHDVGDTSYYEIFAAARYCGIVVRVMNRLVARGVMPPDHQIWLDNPASDCLALLLPD
ncbi:MAG: phosphotransferase family protein [Acidimicrobiales bacterium]